MICVVLLNTLDNMVIPELGKIRVDGKNSLDFSLSLFRRRSMCGYDPESDVKRWGENRL